MAHPTKLYRRRSRRLFMQKLSKNLINSNQQLIHKTLKLIVQMLN
jgi:hypothetical protein